MGFHRTLVNTFNLDLMSLLSDFLNAEDVLLKVMALNRNFFELVDKMKKYDSLWKLKFA